MGGTGEVVHTGFWWGNLMEGDHVEDSGVDGRIILKLAIKQLAEGMDWDDLVQDGDRWCAIVSAVMSSRFS
jgi:hypothetical protein